MSCLSTVIYPLGSYMFVEDLLTSEKNKAYGWYAIPVFQKDEFQE